MNKRDKVVGSAKTGLVLFVRYINLKIMELYWTLCTLFGLRHLHDGSKARVSLMEEASITNEAVILRIKTEEEERINRLIDEATSLQLSRSSEYHRRCHRRLFTLCNKGRRQVNTGWSIFTFHRMKKRAHYSLARHHLCPADMIGGLALFRVPL